MRQHNFQSLFNLACADVLTERKCYIIELRYGFSGKDPLTLRETGSKLGISGERVRQLINKSIGRVIGRGKYEIKKNHIKSPCAELMLYMSKHIRPNDMGNIERIVDFTEAELPGLPLLRLALPLVTHLSYTKKLSKQHSAEAYKLINQRIFNQKAINKQANVKKQLQNKFNQLLSFVTYPNLKKMCTPALITSMNAKRSVSFEGYGKAGVFYSEKLNRSISYESSIELEFFLILEALDEVKFYQEQPLKIPYSFENKKYLYYPDIFFMLTDGTGVVVEIKPNTEMALKINLNKWEALKTYCANQGLGFLITDCRKTIQQIQQHDYSPDFAEDVLLALQNGPLFWKEYEQIKNKHNETIQGFSALVLSHSLKWKLKPFHLSQ